MDREPWSLFVRVRSKETEHALGETTKVGRGPECQVRISHLTCSRLHFTVHRSADGCVLEHAHKETPNILSASATTETFVNGAQKRSAPAARLGWPADRLSHSGSGSWR